MTQNIRNCKNKLIMFEKFKATGGVIIRIHQSKKNRQYNGQKKRAKRANSDLQNITQKTKHRTIGTHLKRGDCGWSGRVSSSFSTCGAHRVTV